MKTDNDEKITKDSVSKTTTTTNKFDRTTWKLISQGAEARVWHIPSFISIHNDTTTNSTSHDTSVICKERFPKKYRHPDLDQSILKSRTKAEARCLLRSRKGGVRCPTVLGVDYENNNNSSAPDDNNTCCIFLEYIPGITVRRYYEIRADENKNIYDNKESLSPPSSSPPCKKTKMEYLTPMDCDVAYAVGTIIAKMHNVNIIHGDLTTSNIMFSNYDNNQNVKEQTSVAKDNNPILVLIDFGLAGTAGAKGVSHEEKAVDLYVLERAFEATHPTMNDCMMDEILRAYKAVCLTSDSVLQRLAAVRLRGRKRECFG